MALAFGIVLYLLGALVALGLPEYYIPVEYWHVRTHIDFVPQRFPTQLLALWTFATVPWLIVVYRQKAAVRISALVLPVLSACLLAVWVKPPHTHDLYVYLGQGRQLMLGVNPYLTTLRECMFDPVIASISKTWFDQPSLYGPLILLLGATANFLGPGWGLIGLGRILKAFWFIPYGLWARIGWRHWSSHHDRNLIVLAIFANPVLIFQVFVEGHADLAMVAFICATGMLLQEGRSIAAGIALSVAACIKMTALVVFPPCACWLFRRQPREALKFASCFLCLYFLSHALFGGGEWFNVAQFNKTWSALWIAGIVPRLLLLLGFNNGAFVHHVSDACFYATVAILCIRLLLGKMTSGPFLPMALTLAALVTTRTHVQSWYYLWFWSMLWMSSKNLKYLLVSIGLWTAAALHTMMYIWWYSTPYVMTLLFAADLWWLRHTRIKTGTANES